MGDKAIFERWLRWDTCSLCEQDYHGVVRCALGWACWKTYLGRPEEDWARGIAMNVLGNGLSAVLRHEDALSVKEAEMSMLRRLGAPKDDILIVQTNLANSYQLLGRREQALGMQREIYSGYGEEHFKTLTATHNYAGSLISLHRSEEAKSMMLKMMPVARRVLGESNDVTLRTRCNYAQALYKDEGATLDDLHEAVTTLEETERTARRVLFFASASSTD